MTMIDWLMTLLLSAFAGVTNFVLDSEHDLVKLISSIIISCFAGMMAMFASKELGASEYMTAIYVSLSALGGKATIELLRAFIMDKLRHFMKN